MELQLRHYQDEADRAHVSGVDRGIRGQLILSTTGSGKTVMQAQATTHTDRKVLVLTTRRLLCRQLARELESLTGDTIDTEMAESRAFDSQGDHARIIVASLQSLKQPRRLRRYNPWDFGLVIADEGHWFHRSVPSVRTVMDHMAQNQRLFFLLYTAWIDPKKRGGYGDYAPEVGLEYGLRQGIEDGYVCEPKQRYISLDEIEWSDVKQTHGEFATDAVRDVMDRTETVHKSVWAGLKELGDRPAMWFCAGVEHAEHVTDAINDSAYSQLRHGKAVAIHNGGYGGKWPCRIKPSVGLRAFRRGEYQHLVVCDMCAEGFDCDRVAGAVMLRPFRKVGPYYQRIGRSVRPLKAIRHLLLPGVSSAVRRAAIAGSAKPDSLIIDVSGASLVHRIRPLDLTDILCKAVGIREEVRANVARRDSSIILSEAELLRRLEGDRQLRNAVSARNVKYTATDVALFGPPQPGTVGAQAKPVNRPNWFIITHLRKAGIHTAGKSKNELQAMYAKIRAASRDKLSTKQEALLKKYGYNDLENWTPWKASIVIDMIAARRWKRPDFPLTRERWLLHHAEGAAWRIKVKQPDGDTYLIGPEFANQDSARTVIAHCLEDEDGRPVKLKPKEPTHDRNYDETASLF